MNVCVSMCFNAGAEYNSSLNFDGHLVVRYELRSTLVPACHNNFQNRAKPKIRRGKGLGKCVHCNDGSLYRRSVLTYFTVNNRLTGLKSLFYRL